ncbi:RNA-directed DNA polymerase, eukaryota, partial [Tanacetum coccineum]
MNFMSLNIQGLGHEAKKGWINRLCSLHKLNFIALQETKMENIDVISIKSVWGNYSFDHDVSSSVGNSGGILCIWDPYMFIKDHVSASDNFLAIMASKMSKLDRFLISKGLMVLFPHLSSSCLDRHLSDHRPIIMYEPVLDYGPSPFRMFHSWFKMEGFDKVVEDSWHSIVVKDTNDQGGGNEEILNQRALLMKDLTEIYSIKASELSQKAKVHWSIEGDENSKYFHRIINSKRSHLNIRGILLDGDWIVDPNKVKSEFLKHFSNQFSKPLSTSVKIDFQFPTRLRLEQLEELEQPISYEEIKKAVWDYGSNKSPALISKIHNAKDVKDFRPVTLIGSLYNVIAKILANRLSLVISDLISDVQSAFISN